MDSIFAKSGVFSVVPIANKEPHRFDKQGNLLIAYGDSDMAHRLHSVVSNNGSRSNSMTRRPEPAASVEKSDGSS